MFKKLLIIFALLRRYYKQIILVISVMLSMFCVTVFATEKTLITINQFANHQALDEAKLGIEAALKNRSLLPKHVEIKFSNAQGSIANTVQIAQYHASLNPKFMIAIATPAAQANLRARSGSALAFVAVTDPGAAGLENTNNVIGVSDAPNIAKLLNITQQLLNFKTIGVIFNPGESSSVQTVEELKKLADTKGIKIQQIAINFSGDIKAATQKLAGQVELIYLPKDNLIVSALDGMLRAADKAKIPVIGNDPSLVDKGLLLAFGCDYFESGKQLGDMIADNIEGKDIEHKIQQAKVNKLQINHKVAAKLNITIPRELELQESR